MPTDHVTIQEDHLHLLRELASRSLTFNADGAIVGVPAGFDRDQVELAFTDPPRILTFHEAWGQAKELPGYNKGAWNQQWSTYTKTEIRKPINEWLALVYGPGR
jgi:hypothetical protein